MRVLKTGGRILLILICTVLILLGAVVLFLFFYPTVGRTPGKAAQEEYARRTELFYDGQFHNVNPVSTMTGTPYPSSDRKTPKTKLPAETPSFLTAPKENDLSFTWFGHSSFLLQMGKTNILVDPVLSERSSPVSFAGPKRFSQLPLRAEELPAIDVLFLSHDHYDHLDYQTIRAIRDRVRSFVVPLGIDSILRGWGVDAEKIHALAWWESAEIDDIRFTLTPSQHFTGRNPLRSNATLWGGVYLDNGLHRVYYTGDGGYQESFAEIRERLGAPELMIAECGQYDTAWASIHMFPEQTVQAGKDVGTQWLIPVHWGSFSICNHAWDDSIRRVTAAAADAGVPLATPRIGQTLDYASVASFHERWWEAYE